MLFRIAVKLDNVIRRVDLVQERGTNVYDISLIIYIRMMAEPFLSSYHNEIETKLNLKWTLDKEIIRMKVFFGIK